MKKRISKHVNRLLILVMIFVVTAALAACGKNNNPGTEGSPAENSATNVTQGSEKQGSPAEAEKNENTEKSAGTESIEKAAGTEGTDKAENAEETPEEESPEEAGHILENEGNLEIEVPEGEETFGE